MHRWSALSLVFLYVITDIIITVISFGFYKTSFRYDVNLIWKSLAFSGGYSFLRSSVDFLVCTTVRCIAVAICALLKLQNLDRPLKKGFVPLLSVFIFAWTFTFVKLLALSEDPIYLTYFGVWLNIVWNIISSSLLLALWHFVICANTVWNYRTLLSMEDALTTPETEHFERRSTFKHAVRLLKYCKNTWRWFTAGFTFLIIYSLARIFIPYYTGQVISGIVQSRGYTALLQSVFYMSLLMIISTLFAGLRGACFDYATALVNRHIRCDLFSSLVEQEIGFFDTTKTGEITSRLTADCQTMSLAISTNVNIFLRNAVMLVGALAFMFALSWRLSLVTFIAVPLVGFLTKLFGSYYDRLSERTQTSFAAANHVAEEVMSTMRTVRSFACEKKEAKKFEDHLGQTISLYQKRSYAYMGFMWTTEFCDSAIFVGVLFYGGYLVLSGKMTAENLISFLLYQLQLGENLSSMGYVFSGVMESVGASRKVFEYMLREPKVLNSGKEKTPVTGEIKFDHVTFAYPSRPTTFVLQDVSFLVNPGETVALVGPSGGGKSSIVSLIEHFYECTAGHILIDGVPVSDYDHNYIHQKVALVAQEPVLYEGTIRYNIMYGCDWATEDDMLNASKMANVHNFVAELEMQYDTNCGEKGVQLSGGQKQRVAIARALVRQPAVLILDEATSALDAESEHIVQQAIAKCSKEKTVIVIAHRLSTVEKADRIIVVNQGKVVQQGKHAELLLQPGLYQSLVQRQLLGGNILIANQSNDI